MNYTNAAPLQAAREYIQQGLYQQAWYILDQIVKYGPADVEAYYLLSLITSDKREQINLLEKVLVNDPYHAHARNLLNELEGISNPPTYIPNTNPNSKPNYKSVIKDSGSIMSEALTRIWEVLEPLRESFKFRPNSDSFTSNSASPSAASPNFTSENDKSSKSPVLASLSDMVWITNEGIGYKVKIPSIIPFINKGEEYGYSPLHYINAVEIKLQRLIPIWPLIIASLITIGFIGYKVFPLLIYPYHSERPVNSEVVTALIILGFIYFLSSLSDQFLVIRSAGTLFLSVKVNNSEREVKHFLETYLQLNTSRNAQNRNTKATNEPAL